MGGGSVLADVDEALPRGPEGGLGARAESQLAQYVGDVGPGGAFAYSQLGGDLLVGPPGTDQREHLELARGELRRHLVARADAEGGHQAPGDRGVETELPSVG